MMNECWEKPQKCMCMSNVLALCRIDEHTCMWQSMRLEVLNLKITDHLALLLNTMYHVQCVTLQHGELLWWFLHNMPAHHSGPQEYYGYLMANYHGDFRTMFECVYRNPQSMPGSTADRDGTVFYHVEVKCNHGIPCPPYDTQKEVTCVVCTK